MPTVMENAAASPETSTPSKTSETASHDIRQKNGKEDPEYLSGLPLMLLIVSLLLAILLMALDISIVSTAMPRITDTFNTIQDIGWYGAAFSFSNAALQPMSGKIYSFFPMKQSFIAFVSVFELGSLISATSASSTMFIIGRAISGIGSSGLVNGALSIVALAGPPEKRPMLMGIIMGLAGAGQLLGPLVGGALTQHVTWHWCFYLNLPAGAITIIFMTFIRFPNNASSRKTFQAKSITKDFDILGFLLFVPSIIMFMMALQWGGVKYAWSSATIIGLLVGFFVALIPLSYWEYKQGHEAMFPFPLLRRRVIYCACLTAFMAGGATLTISYYLPLWFQTVKFAGPLRSAINTLPSFLSQMAGAILTGALCPRYIPYLIFFAVMGSIIHASGNAALTTFTPSTGVATWIGIQILSGAGRGLNMQVPVQTVQQHVSKSEIAVSTAVVSFFQFFGGSIFLALCQTAFSNFLKHALTQYAPGLDPSVVIGSGATVVRANVPTEFLGGVREAYNDAITRTYWLGFGAAIVGLGSSCGLGWTRIETKAKGRQENSEMEKNE